MLAAMTCLAALNLCLQVYRDKSLKRVTLEELKAQQEASKKPVAETPEWGGGMAQKREAEERRQQLQAEAAKPFARRRSVKSSPAVEYRQNLQLAAFCSPAYVCMHCD